MASSPQDVTTKGRDSTQEPNVLYLRPVLQYARSFKFNVRESMSFYLLGLSILLVFVPYKLSFSRVPLWCMSFFVTVICAIYEGVLDVQGVAILAAYCLLLYGAIHLRQVILRKLCVVVFGVVSLALAMHLLPGFHNLLIVQPHNITDDAVPFKLYANFDKGLVGLFLLGFIFRGQINRNYYRKRPKAKLIGTIFCVTPILVFACALLLGLIQFDPKWPSFWLYFLGINLLFTCVAEEAFFRGYLQQGLSSWLHEKPYILFVVPFISGVIFGVAHFGGGVGYVLTASLAGVGYALLYHKTHRIELSILCHFLLNVLHLFLFTYPMLA